MNLELGPGEEVLVTFRDTDGGIAVQFREDALIVSADMPDDKERVGVIYEERFDSEEEEEPEPKKKEVCGKWVKPCPPGTKGLPTRCVLRPGHSGSCVDRDGNRRKNPRTFGLPRK